MNWTEGYASDVEYVSGFYQEQSPVFLNFVCALNGVEPVPLDRPFTYFELGFGRGLTVNILAASNPNGQFYATDFNPAHVANANKLASSAKLDNLTLLENNFAELAEGKVDNLPQFDFITLHGIYTWVTAENRSHIVNFITRYLKPGGIVFLSYNAMPGWSAALPLQRLLTEHAALNPNRSDLQLKSAAGFAEQLNTAQAAYFTDTPVLKKYLDMLKTLNPQYLVHEYMHRHWQPMYHADVARDLAIAKLDFVGAAQLHFAYPALYLSAEKQALLDGVSDPALRETLKDYMLNTVFRKDVFVRGARRMPAVRHAECLRDAGIALNIPRSDVNLSLKLNGAEVKAKPEAYNPVLDALAERPHTITELMQLPSMRNATLGDVTQIVALLAASGQTSVYFGHRSAIDAAPALRMNRELAGQTRYHDDYQSLASPLLGNGIPSNDIERLVYFFMAQQQGEVDVNGIVRQAWQVMTNRGRRMMRDGKPITSEQENLANLAESVKAVLKNQLPLWHQLKMI